MKYVGESIVFLVDGNSPSTFNERFIVHHKIYPDSLEIMDSVQLPPVSQIKFTGGHVFQAVDNKIKLEYNVNEPIEINDTFTSNEVIQDSAIKLSKAVPYIDYYALGINYTLLIENFDLNYFNNNALNEFNTNALQIFKELRPFKLNVNFNRATKDTKFEINLHHELKKGDDNNIHKFIQLIEERNKFYQTSLDEINNIIK